MTTCKECGESYNSSHYCDRLGRTIHEPEDNSVGTLGIGFDPACGKLEPTINLGGGIGIGLDGDITIGGF